MQINNVPPPCQCGYLGHSSPAGVPAIPEDTPYDSQDEDEGDGRGGEDTFQDSIPGSPVAIFEQAKERPQGLFHGSTVEVDMYAFVRHGELKGNGLMSLRHV